MTMTDIPVLLYIVKNQVFMPFGRFAAFLLAVAAIVSCDGYKRCLDRTDGFLADLGGSFVAEIVRYDGNRMAEQLPFESGTLAIDETTKWSLDVRCRKAGVCKDAIDYDLVFKLEEGMMPSSGTAVKFTFDGWTADNYLFAPSAIYDGNRFRIVHETYPPYMYADSLRTPDMPITITDVPHMHKDGTDGRIEMLTSNCSTPLAGFFDKAGKRGFFLQTVQDTVLGNSSFIIEESLERGVLSIMMGAPGIREKQYHMCRTGESEDVPFDFKAGDEIRMQFRLYDFAAEDLNAYFDRFLTERKSLTTNELVNKVPFSNIVPQIIDHHLRHKWYEGETSAYLCNIPGHDRPAWNLQLGWNGVPVYTLSQILKRETMTDEQLRRLALTFGSIKQMQTSTGFFYAMLVRDHFAGDTARQRLEVTDIAMMRRTAITIYYSLQIFDLLKMRGLGDMVDPAWEEMIHSAADAVVRIWKEYGEFGQHVNAVTGRMTTFNSSNGVLNIGALAYASVYFDEPEYLEIAKAAAEFYYERDLCNGYLGGAPAEILQAPDSEASAEMTESCMALFEITREGRWLEMARAAAAYFSTWVVPYDFKFPVESTLGRVGAHSAGSVWASIQNEHSAPGIYIMSGDFLLKLYRATGDFRYVEMERDIVHNVVQYVNTKDNPIILDGEYGAVSERVNLSDWEGKSSVGGCIIRGDSNIAWENVALFSIIQNPGIYFQSDTRELVVFDHVDVSVLDDHGALLLEIENPTDYDADVSIMVETSDDARNRSMGWFAYDSWPTVDVPARSKVIWKL